MESNFVDYVKIVCRSGKGGRGSMHMHRAKYAPNGGPDGGNGGRGGHVILRGNHNYWTLLHLRYDRHIFATQERTEAKTNQPEQTDKTVTLTCLAEPLSIMQKLENTSAMSKRTDRR